LFLLIGVGFFVVRAGLIPAGASKPMSTLLMKVAVPATVFCSMLRPYDPSFLKLGGSMLLLGAVMLPAYAALSLGLARALGVPEGRKGMWCCCATFGNNGFMGFPVALALFGEEGLSLTVILSIPFSFLLFSMGAKLICMDQPEGSAAAPVSWRQAVFSGINLSMALGLVVYFTQIQIPQAVLGPLEYLADMTTPLSMIVSGMNLSQGKLSEVVRDRGALTASGFRLLVYPLLGWCVLRLIPGLDSLVFGAFLINMAMPTAAVTTFIAEEHDGCTQLAARTVFLSSLLCILTIPLISLLI
jgi:hypothetical protein